MQDIDINIIYNIISQYFWILSSVTSWDIVGQYIILPETTTIVINRWLLIKRDIDSLTNRIIL